MKKKQLNDLTFINIYDKQDFITGDNIINILSSCENIIKSSKNNEDLEKINLLRDKTTSIFLKGSNLMAFILYSTEGCPPGKRKSVAFAYISSTDTENKYWSIDFLENRLNSNPSNKETLLDNIILFLKSINAEKVSFTTENNDKELYELANSFITKYNIEMEENTPIEIEDKEEDLLINSFTKKHQLVYYSLQFPSIDNKNYIKQSH